MEATPSLIESHQIICFGVTDNFAEENFVVGGREVFVIVSRREERELFLRLIVGPEMSSNLKVDLVDGKTEGEFAGVNYCFSYSHFAPHLVNGELSAAKTTNTILECSGGENS